MANHHIKQTAIYIKYLSDHAGRFLPESDKQQAVVSTAFRADQTTRPILRPILYVNIERGLNNFESYQIILKEVKSQIYGDSTFEINWVTTEERANDVEEQSRSSDLIRKYNPTLKANDAVVHPANIPSNNEDVKKSRLNWVTDKNNAAAADGEDTEQTAAAIVVAIVAAAAGAAGTIRAAAPNNHAAVLAAINAINNNNDKSVVLQNIILACAGAHDAKGSTISAAATNEQAAAVRGAIHTIIIGFNKFAASLAGLAVATYGIDGEDGYTHRAAADIDGSAGGLASNNNVAYNTLGAMKSIDQLPHHTAYTLRPSKEDIAILKVRLKGLDDIFSAGNKPVTLGRAPPTLGGGNKSRRRKRYTQKNIIE